MKYITLLFLVLLSFHLPAQETSITSQDFPGVKSVKFYTTTTDSAGKVISKKNFFQEIQFDSNGRKERVFNYEKRKLKNSAYYFYDSLGRMSMRINWTKKEGNLKYLYEYSLDSTGHFIIQHELHDRKITRTESSFWDTLSKCNWVSTWYGESTYGAPPSQDCYDKNGQLMRRSSLNGFTEYRYDSLGNLTMMLVRHFEDGHCSGYNPLRYTNTYKDGHLSTCATKWSTTWFDYNEKGLIFKEHRRVTANQFVVTEAEYTYY
ncbi:MAG TPA: hypothetical protein VK826_15255 [Bacteroidia bacterium]|nr:hypothetical protein [Bacteroidia bacterium]